MTFKATPPNEPFSSDGLMTYWGPSNRMNQGKGNYEPIPYAKMSINSEHGKFLSTSERKPRTLSDHFSLSLSS